MPNKLKLIDMINDAKTKFMGDGKEDFFKIISDVKPFVFQATAGETLKIDEGKTPDIDLPFPTISIEIDLGSVAVDKEKIADISCIVVNETAPKEYDYYLHALVREGMMVAKINHKSNGLLVEELLKRIKKENLGVIKKKYRVKFRNNGVKQVRKINRIIHVVPNKSKKKFGLENKVEWSHKFWVRGHWRKFDGKGKDRAGERIIEGWTWVKHHIKGKGELIEKIRAY